MPNYSLLVQKVKVLGSSLLQYLTLMHVHRACLQTHLLFKAVPAGLKQRYSTCSRPALCRDVLMMCCVVRAQL